MGGVYLANDSVAGEKERGTLETLLVSPASRRDLVLGKFMAVASVSLVSCLLSLAGFVWPFYIKLPMFSWMTREGLSLHPAAVLAILLVQVPLAVLGAGILLTISTFARNQKEAQTYLAPVLLIVNSSRHDHDVSESGNAPVLDISSGCKRRDGGQAGIGRRDEPALPRGSQRGFPAVRAWLPCCSPAHAFQKESILLKA